MPTSRNKKNPKDSAQPQGTRKRRIKPKVSRRKKITMNRMEITAIKTKKKDFRKDQ